MGEKSKLEEALHEKQQLHDKIRSQEEVLMRLDALKRTFVKAMVKDDLYLGLPMSNYTKSSAEVIRVRDEYPLFILNVGEIVNLQANCIIPINFRVLRWFMKSRLSKRAGEYTWYTTTVLNKHDEVYLHIQDDENNTWRGADAFAKLHRSFDGEIPFTSAAQWLGVDKEEVQMIIRSQESYKRMMKWKSENV